jgi:hypothetical protein
MHEQIPDSTTGGTFSMVLLPQMTISTAIRPASSVATLRSTPFDQYRAFAAPTAPAGYG